MARLATVCLMTALCMGVACADEFETITLKHRSVDEVLPLVRPLLDNGGVANGMNDQLFLRTSPQNLAQIKQLLKSIDTAPRRLRISVMQDVDRETLARTREMSGSMGIGAAGRVSVPGSDHRDGLNVRLQQGDEHLNARIDSKDARLQDHNTQQLQVLEGGRAFVRIGQSVPVPQRQVIQHPWGNEVIEQTQYQEVGSGFYVTPRLQGDNVTLEVSTQNDSVESVQASYPRENIQHASTTISGRLGEWLELGWMSQQQNNESDTLSSRHSSKTNEQRNIFIRVEEIQ